MVAWLSAGRETSVISHESALAIHGISDIIPSSTHLTVPRNRRWYGGKANETIHTVVEPLKDTEVVVRDGIRLTAPARSIVDAAEWGTSPEHIESAVRDALRRGMTTRDRLLAAAADRSGEVRARIDRVLERVFDEV